MTGDDGGHLSRRLHWESDDGSTAGGVVPASPERDGRSFELRELDRIDEEALDRRRQLWRDTAMLLTAVVAALLVANLLGPELSGIASVSPAPSPTPTPTPTGMTLVPSATPTDAPVMTSEPIVDPSLGIDATPTPIPALTLPPTGTFAPGLPAATLRPTPRPTRRPTPQPTMLPTLPPTAAPTPEVTPPPTPELTPEPTPEITPEVTPPPEP